MTEQTKSKLESSPKTKIQLLGKYNLKGSKDSSLVSKTGSIVERPDSSGSSSF